MSVTEELPKKLLLVDNDEPFLKSVSFMLEPKGVNVLQAKDWESALYLFNNNRVDVAIVELELEGLNGMALIQKWRNHEIQTKRDAGFILATGKHTEIASDRALVNELEDITVIEKPFNVAKLMIALINGMKVSRQREKFNEVDYKVIRPLLNKDKFEKALDIARNKLEPIGPRGVFKSAIIHADAGKPERALQLMDKLLKDDPNNLRYQNEAGKINLKMGNPEKARQYFEAADKLAPDNIERMYQMATMYLQLKEPDKSVEKMQQLLKTSPEQPDLKYDMFDQLLDAGFEKHAQDFCEKTSTASELLRHFNNKGVMYSKTGDFAKSVSEYEKALKLIPGNKENYRVLFNMAISHINMKTPDDISKARVLLAECLDLKPNFDKAKEKLVMVEKYLENQKSA
ncbi:MAG: tetratricopeptide repeat protein [Deltaproteobacteria bacterium]|nr:tetratricopeptide repeat protein [Deltaproteobacteria bacterium]